LLQLRLAALEVNMAARLVGAIAALALVIGTVAPALAQRHDERFERRDEGWRDRDIHRFHERDFDRWRGGHWFRGRHDGRVGWWWVVGPSWYYYPRAIYPYPDPYVPPFAVPGGPAWYYCPPLQTYYPYTPSCPVPWQVVQAR
jgi:hypothetical protein